MRLQNALHSMDSKPGVAAPRPRLLFSPVKCISILSIGAVTVLCEKPILHPTLKSEGAYHPTMVPRSSLC